MTNTKDRNDCWLGMSAAQLVMECQDLCKQRDELLEQVECSNITEKNMEGRLNKLIVQNAATKDRLDEHRDGRLSALEKLAVAEKQRDELLSELEKLTGVLATIGITTGLYDNEQDALKAACDAIARAKGEQ